MQILSLLRLVKNRALKKTLALVRLQVLLDMPLKGAHSLSTPLGGEGYSACSSHHNGGLPGE